MISVKIIFNYMYPQWSITSLVYTHEETQRTAGEGPTVSDKNCARIKRDKLRGEKPSNCPHWSNVLHKGWVGGGGASTAAGEYVLREKISVATTG